MPNEYNHIGYVPESTYSVRNPLTPLATTQLTAFGEIVATQIENAKLEANIIRRFIQSKYTANSLIYGRGRLSGKIPFIPLNGVDLYYAQGKISTAGGGPPYVHTITSLTPADGAVMPSRTLHIERLGGTVEQAFDYPGMITNTLEISIDLHEEHAGLSAILDYRTQRMVEDTVGTNPAKIANANVKPAVQTGSGTERYFVPVTATVDVTGADAARDYLTFLKSILIRIENTYIENPDLNRSGTDEYGKDEKRWLKTFYLDKQKINVSFAMLRGKTYSQDLSKGFVNGVTQNDVVIKVQRSADDYIQWTFDTTNVMVTDVTDALPAMGISPDYSAYVLEAVSLSTEVKDTITGANFV